jgi:hypothetical protein
LLLVQVFLMVNMKLLFVGELKQDGDSNNTHLTLTHRRLTKSTSLRFAPGWHAYLDRLEAILNNQVPPDWAHRFAEIKKLYPS